MAPRYSEMRAVPDDYQPAQELWPYPTDSGRDFSALEFLASFMPVHGEAIAAADVNENLGLLEQALYDARYKDAAKDSGWAALSALGLLPIVPALGSVRKVSKAGMLSTSPKVAAAQKRIVEPVARAVDDAALVTISPQARAAAEAARLRRAEEMGFLPEDLFHGTKGDFTAFDIGRSGKNTGAGEHAIFMTDNPKVAEHYANYSQSSRALPEIDKLTRAERHAYNAGDETTGAAIEALRVDLEDAAYKMDSAIMPLRMRAGNPAVVDMAGALYRPTIVERAIAKARNKGNDALIMRNLVDGAGVPSNIYVAFDPAQIRSQFANFDPAKKDSADLLAGIAGLGLAGALSAGYLQQD